MVILQKSTHIDGRVEGRTPGSNHLLCNPSQISNLHFYQQVNDSTVIISTLQSYLKGNDRNLLTVVKCYPIVNYNDDDGVKRSEIMNRYFVMMGDQELEGITKEFLA